MVNKFYNSDFCSDQNLLTMLRVSRTQGIGPITFLKLLKKFGNPDNILHEIERVYSEKGILKKN